MNANEDIQYEIVQTGGGPERKNNTLNNTGEV